MAGPLLCPSCRYPTMSEWHYCPHCGIPLSESANAIPLSKQFLIYIVSFILAPAGLIWGLKYIRSKNTKVKTVGIVSLVLTIIAVALMFALFKIVTDNYTQMLNSIMNGYTL